MGQKDLAAKQFERSPEVFADIINALVYEGEQVVIPTDLRPAPTESLYAAKNGMLRNQYNDVSKYEIKESRIAVQYTLENQSSPDYKLLLRKAGYEGAIYRQQYDGGDTYPAITFVLYWGDSRWKPGTDLHSFFGRKKIHSMARAYIDNISLHMYPMRHLPKEIRQRFKSDMRVVVDYLAEGESYIPTKQKITDLEGTMRILYALTGETDFVDNLGKLQKQQEKGEKITMEYALTRMKREGREQGIKEGIKKGIKEGIKEGMVHCARAFVQEAMVQKQSQEYILSMLQTCFQMKEEEAVSLYREGAG